MKVAPRAIRIFWDLQPPPRHAGLWNLEYAPRAIRVFWDLQSPSRRAGLWNL